MGTRFIMDPEFKKKRETIAEILQIAKKKPYPNKNAVHLARFIDSAFTVITDEKKKVLLEKEAEEKRKRLEALKKEKEEKEKAKLAALEASAPLGPGALEVPEPPTLDLGGLEAPDNLALLKAPQGKPEGNLPKREYVLKLYNAPVGVLVDKEDGKYEYKVIEPVMDPRIIETAISLFGKNLLKDNSLFDNVKFMKMVTERTAIKSGTGFNEMMVPSLRYYLERDLLGGGKLDPIMYDDKVKKVSVDGPRKAVRVEYDDLGEMPSNLWLDTKEDIDKILKRIAAATGKSLNEDNPMLDVSFQGLHFKGAIGKGDEQSKLEIRRV